MAYNNLYNSSRERWGCETLADGLIGDVIKYGYVQVLEEVCAFSSRNGQGPSPYLPPSRYLGYLPK